MIDFVKFEIKNVELSQFLDNPLLRDNWKIEIDNETAVVESYRCEYKNLFLKIYEERKTLIAKGSLPKIANGKNNVDLSFKEITKLFRYLKEDLFIDPSKSILRNIEFGLNIEIPKSPNDILDKFLMYRTNPFIPMRSNSTRHKFGGVESNLSQFRIKIYDKGKQMDLEENLMRIEIKVNKMQFFKTHKIRIKHLSNLADKTVLEGLGSILIEIYGSILKCCKINTETLKPKYQELMKSGCYPSYWTKLHKEDSQRCFRKRKLFIKLQNENRLESLHNLIQNRISKKWQYLLNQSEGMILKSDENLPLLKAPIIRTELEASKTKNDENLPLAFSVNFHHFYFSTEWQQKLLYWIDYLSRILKT